MLILVTAGGCRYCICSGRCQDRNRKCGHKQTDGNSRGGSEAPMLRPNGRKLNAWKFLPLTELRFVNAKKTEASYRTQEFAASHRDVAPDRSGESVCGADVPI